MKIFNISFHRNATTSFSEFMKRHNCASLHDTWLTMKTVGLGDNWNQEVDLSDVHLDAKDRFMNRINEKKLHQLIAQYDVFSDNPFPIIYESLYENYPDAKFILFYRDPLKWIASMKQYFGGEETVSRRLIYKNVGSPTASPQLYTTVYQKHNSDVIRFFSEKENFLAINLDTDNIEARLKKFLQLESDIRFPKQNISKK